jgi:hypothetical protein
LGNLRDYGLNIGRTLVLASSQHLPQSGTATDFAPDGGDEDFRVMRLEYYQLKMFLQKNGRVATFCGSK